MWFKSDEDIDTLIAKGKLTRAAKLLREQLQSKPKSTRLRQQLGDVLGRAGKPEEAISVLAPLVHEFAKQGFSTKAIAVVKKIQRLDPGRKDTDQLVQRVRHEAEAPPAINPPLVHGHLSSEPEYYEQPESQPTGYAQIPGVGLQTPGVSPEAEASTAIKASLRQGSIPNRKRPPSSRAIGSRRPLPEPTFIGPRSSTSSLNTSWRAPSASSTC